MNDLFFATEMWVEVMSMSDFGESFDTSFSGEALVSKCFVYTCIKYERKWTLSYNGC